VPAAASHQATRIESRHGPRRLLPSAVVALFAAATLVAGCGGSGGDGEAGQGAETPSTAATSTTVAPTTATTAPLDKRLFILSDSVMLGALNTVPAALPDWKVTFDGKESRFITAAVDELRARQGELGPVVMAQVGNNYDGDEAAFAAGLDALYDVVGPDRTLILLHVYPIEENRAEVNAALDALAAKHPNVKVADWPSVVDADPSIATKDGLHLKPRGTEVMAQFVKQQLDALPPGALVTPPASAASAPTTTAPTTAPPG
jgi:hypothetical protein